MIHTAEQLEMFEETRLPFCSLKAKNIRDICDDPADPDPSQSLPPYLFKMVGSILSPYFVQEKLNGVGFRARALPNALELWTTRGKPWRGHFFPDLVYNGLYQILVSQPPGSVLLGEFTSADPNTKLATFAGQVSVNSEKFSGDSAALRANVYDIWPNNGKLFQYRIKDLDRFRTWGHPRVRVVDTWTCSGASRVKQLFSDITADGGEGIIIRIDPCILSPKDSGVHPMILKWKDRVETEGTCLAVFEGEGKRTGMLGSMTVRVTIDGVTTDFQLGGGPGLNDDLLTRLLKNPPIGLPITFTYEELSINGTPLRPQFVAVRNYE